MEDPFDTPTARPNNPINDALRAESANLDPLPPSRLSSPPLPYSERSRMRSTDTSTTRTNSRMSQVRQNSFVSLPKKSISSPPPSSSYGKASKGPPKRPVNDRAKSSSIMDNQSVHSQSQSRQPHAQDFAGHTPEELVRFAALCRRQYYDKDNEAARKVGELLAKLPPSSVAVFSRTMANIRSEYHRDKEIERRLHVETTLAAILPGQTIKMALGVSLEDGIGGGVAAMRSSKARKARHQAFKAFIDTNCVKQVPGLHPFFRSLFAMLWLQSIEPGRGGAGPRRVEWEVDVAVFSEAGGGEAWVGDVVETLKGVLGMSERIKEPSHTDTFRSSVRSESINIASHEEDQPGTPALEPGSLQSTDEGELEPRSLPEEYGVLPSSSKKQPPAVPPHRASLRNRAPSDPFLDPGDKHRAASTPSTLSPRQLPTSPPSPLTTNLASPDLSTATSSTPFLTSSGLPSPDPTSPLSLPVSRPPLLPSRSSQVPPLPAVEPQFRVFTLPSYLTNPELRSLCRLFPDFISSPARTGARFRSASVGSTDRTKAQEDAGVNERGGGLAKVGHGELRIGSGERDVGWRGTLWERILAWFAAFFRRG